MCSSLFFFKVFPLPTPTAFVLFKYVKQIQQTTSLLHFYFIHYDYMHKIFLSLKLLQKKYMDNKNEHYTTIPNQMQPYILLLT